MQIIFSQNFKKSPLGTKVQSGLRDSPESGRKCFYEK